MHCDWPMTLFILINCFSYIDVCVLYCMLCIFKLYMYYIIVKFYSNNVFSIVTQRPDKTSPLSFYFVWCNIASELWGKGLVGRWWSQGNRDPIIVKHFVFQISTNIASIKSLQDAWNIWWNKTLNTIKFSRCNICLHPNSGNQWKY